MAGQNPHPHLGRPSSLPLRGRSDRLELSAPTCEHTFACPTSSSTATPPSRSSTGPRIRSSWRPPPLSRGTRRSRSPTTTACTGRWSSPRPRGRSASGPSPAPSSRSTTATTSRCCARTATGYRNLCRLITHAHADTRARRAATRVAARASPLEEVERHAAGLVCLSGCARDGALAARVERGEHARGRRARAPPAAAPSGPSASASSSSARSRAATAAATACSPQLAERLGRAVRGHGQRARARALARAPLQDAFVAVRLQDDARRVRARCGAATPRTRWRRRRRWPSASPTTPRRCTSRAAWPSGSSFDLTRDLGYRYPGAEDADRRPPPGRALPRAAWRSATRARQPRPEADRAARGGAGASSARSACPGFFLLHRDLLELAREVALRGARPRAPPARCCRRGGGGGRACPRSSATSPGSRTSTRSRTSCSLGRFLNEELARAARHRPRLPARHPRGADPARARALRPRALGARGGLRRPTAYARRCATSARRSGCRRGGRARRALVRPLERRTTWSATLAARIGERRAASPRWRALVAAGGRGRGPAAPREPAPRRDGHLHRAADRRLPGAAARPWRAARSCSGTRTPAPTPAS